MSDIREFLERARAAQAAGRRDEAIRAYVETFRLAYGNGVAKQAMNVIAKEFFGESIAIRDTGDIEGALSLAVKSLELNPSSSEVLNEHRRLLETYIGGRDMTSECLIFPDQDRATHFYGTAIDTALDFAVYGGVVGNIYEFGVLAGWTSRLFAERMRKIQFFGDLYLFDSFEGLPRNKVELDLKSYDVERGIWDQEMELPADIIEEIGAPIEEHIAYRLSHVISADRVKIRKGFYSESLREPLTGKAAIVHVDCDLYQSTVEVLDALDRDDILQDGTVLMFDDWNCNRGHPAFGQRRALREFLDRHTGRYDVSHYFNYGFNCSAFILHDMHIAPDFANRAAQATAG